MASASLAGTNVLGDSASSPFRRTWVRASLWSAFIVVVLVALQTSLAIVSWQWTLQQISPIAGSFGQGLAYLMMSAFVGQAFLFAFWLTWTPMPTWFRLPLIFAMVYCVSTAVFDQRVLYGAIAIVLIAAAFLEPLRMLTKWRCDYSPRFSDSNTLPPFPLRLNLRDVGESVATLGVFLGIAYWISGTGPGELQPASWAYLVVLTFCGLLLCVPATFLVFSPKSRGLWVAFGLGNGALFFLMLIAMTVFPVSLLYAAVVAVVLIIPQLLCAGTLFILKKLGWRFYSIASEVRNPSPFKKSADRKGLVPARLWNASIIAAIVMANGLFTIAMIKGMSEIEINNAWVTFLVQGPGIAVLIGQLVLLGMWCAWTPMPSWIRFPLILSICYVVDRLTFGANPSLGVMGALILAAMLEPMRMLTKWRCDYRAGAPESSTLPPVTFKLSLGDIFESVLAWAFIFGGWRTITATGNAQDFWNLLKVGLFVCLVPLLSVPAGLLVFAPRSKWLWGIVIATVALHFAICGVIAYMDSTTVLSSAMWSIYWFGSAALCVGTLFVLKKLGWRFYSATESGLTAVPAPTIPASLAIG